MYEHVIDIGGFAWRLAQRPRGFEAAEVLLSALCMDAFDLERAGRAGTLSTPQRRVRTSPLDADEAAWMDRLIRDEILGWTWHTTRGVRWQSLVARAAGDQVLDAFTASYAAGTSPAGLKRVDGVRTLFEVRNHELDLGPNAASIYRLVTRLVELPRDGGPSWTTAARDRWTAAVRDAGLAARLTDRVRLVASAQLLAVSEWSRSGPLNQDYREAWQAGSGLLRGLVVCDVLGDDAMSVLVERWCRATGESCDLSWWT